MYAASGGKTLIILYHLKGSSDLQKTLVGSKTVLPRKVLGTRVEDGKRRPVQPDTLKYSNIGNIHMRGWMRLKYEQN